MGNSNVQKHQSSTKLSGAALQFVRKISGYNKPSKVNQEAFERAVLEISESSDRLLKSIGASSRFEQKT
jgi:hypothetical protein